MSAQTQQSSLKDLEGKRQCPHCGVLKPKTVWMDHVRQCDKDTADGYQGRDFADLFGLEGA